MSTCLGSSGVWHTLPLLLVTTQTASVPAILGLHSHLFLQMQTVLSITTVTLMVFFVPCTVAPLVFAKLFATACRQTTTAI